MSNGAIAFWAALVAFGIDYGSKWYILERLAMQTGEALAVIPGILTYVMSWNRGINFGLFQSGEANAQLVLIAIALGVSLLLIVWTLRRHNDGWFALGTGLMIGGALGNALDRYRFEAVADFLNVTCCGIQNPFAFNLADVAIFLGAALVILRTWNDGAQT